MTCNSKPLGSENAEPPVQKDTSSLVMTFMPDNFKQPVERTAYRSYKTMPDINCSSRVDHIPAERFRVANYFSPGQKLGVVDTECLISL
ncbi:hypothetical protein [Dysgonomonas alginatilytica]|nr:hypothetical protein [Dysgonomonas alginatilytica]